MIHAVWKETVSYVGRDLSNTPYVIIPLATPGSLETIINNTYQNCFHSLCPGGLPPSSHTTPTPFFPMTNESPVSLCFLHDHTTGWAFQTYQCPLNSELFLGPALVSLACVLAPSSAPPLLWDPWLVSQAVTGKALISSPCPSSSSLQDPHLLARGP